MGTASRRNGNGGPPHGPEDTYTYVQSSFMEGGVVIAPKPEKPVISSASLHRMQRSVINKGLKDNPPGSKMHTYWSNLDARLALSEADDSD